MTLNLNERLLHTWQLLAPKVFLRQPKKAKVNLLHALLQILDEKLTPTILVNPNRVAAQDRIVTVVAQAVISIILITTGDTTTIQGITHVNVQNPCMQG